MPKTSNAGDPSRETSRRTTRTSAACLAIVPRFAQSAEKRRRRLNGHQFIPDVLRGVRFIDGIEIEVAA